MADLEDYLQGEVSEGQLDSHGVFSLSLSDALKKFGAYGSQIASGFILKLVQAACLMGAERVLIDQHPSKLIIHVQVAAVDFRGLMGNFERHLLGSTSSWESYLCRALLSASAETRGPSYLAFWENERCSAPMVFPQASSEAAFKLVIEPSVRSGFTWQMETPTDWKLDTQGLMSRLGFCPFPVIHTQKGQLADIVTDLRVNGWEVSAELGKYSPSNWQLIADLYSCEQVTKPCSMLLRPVSGHSSGGATSMPRLGNSQALDWLKGQSPRLVDVPYRGLLGEATGKPVSLKLRSATKRLELFTFPGSLQAAFMTKLVDRLIPVVWGVALEPVLQGWKCYGLEVVACMSELPTDLTRERLINGPELATWLTEKRAVLADWLDQPLAQVEAMSVGRYPSQVPTVIGATLGALSAVALGMPIAAPHGGLVGGLLGAGVRKVLGKGCESWPNPRLRDHFRASLLEIQRQLRHK